jgi:hypothetical protein
VVAVSNLDEAKENFAALAGIDIDGLDATKTVTDNGVGKLTWTPSPEGADNIATVDVESSLLPRLRQIVYCTSEQTGKNFFGQNVTGTAYYRFGDVVRDKEGYYWVCVRPCFEPDKGTSHWINIFNASASGDNKAIPEKYIQGKWSNQAKYNNATIMLPTKLPFDAQHTFNLSQLVWALINPTEYENTYKRSRYNALGHFDAQYNGRLFIERVANFWNQPTENSYTVWEILFNRTQEQMRSMNQLEFLNQGYSWKLGYTAKAYRYKSNDYRAMFKSGEDDYLEFDVRQGFDIRNYASDPNGSKNIQNKELDQFYSYGKFKSGRWVIRYATGKELDGVHFSPYEPLTNCTDIYVYNKKTNKNPRTALETEDDIAGQVSRKINNIE